MSTPRIYLSGRFTTGTKIEAAWLKRTGCKYRCFSFANVVKGQMWYNKKSVQALEVCEKKDIGIMMDSGAHSLHKIEAESMRRGSRASGKQTIDIEEEKDKMFKDYVSYVKKNKKKWDFYVTLDFIRHQPSILAMQRKFEGVGLRPVPVYHGDHSLDWMLRYEGCDLFGIGIYRAFRGKGWRGTRFFLDQLFDFAAKHNFRLHGLAATSLSIMTMYPWWSVDSSTWSKSATFGCINYPDPDKNTIYNLHISERLTNSEVASYNTLQRKQQEMIEEHVKELGFDFKAMRRIKGGEDERHNFNGWVFSNLDKVGIDFTKQREKAASWERLV